MSRFKHPCSLCGVPTKETICEECSAAVDRRKIKPTQVKTSSAARGYNSKWRRLSEQARRAQPFCIDCGSTNDLQADHSPATWEKVNKGLPLNLNDVEVVCGPCNRKRGAARGQRKTR